MEINKVKVHPITDHEGSEGEWRYNSTLSLTSALDGVGGRHPRPLYPRGKRPGTYFIGGRTVAQWLRHYATNRHVAGSISGGVIGIFQ
jgi:hypothetical protein